MLDRARSFGTMAHDEEGERAGVLLISITPMPAERENHWTPQRFRVSFHLEGTGRSLLQEVVLDPDLEQTILEQTDALMWSGPSGYDDALALGRILHETFIGPLGEELLGRQSVGGVLLDVDESILHVPWELLNTGIEMLPQKVRFGRVVTTRRLAQPPRVVGDTLNILGIIDPTGDLPMADQERSILEDLRTGLAALTGAATNRSGWLGSHGPRLNVVSKFLDGRQGTFRAVVDELESGEFEIVHFAGHSYFDRDFPGKSALVLADGVLTASDIVRLEWRDKPPLLVFTSSCESTAAAVGQRLVVPNLRDNGLASAFHANGVESFGGFFWPVTDLGASTFVSAFYHALAESKQVGASFLRARRAAAARLPFNDLTVASAVLYGDVSVAEITDARRLVRTGSGQDAFDDEPTA